MTDPMRIMLDRVGAAARAAVDRALEQADPHGDFGDMIADAMRAGVEAGADVYGDYLLYGNNPPPPRPLPGPFGFLSGSGPVPKLTAADLARAAREIRDGQP